MRGWQVISFREACWKDAQVALEWSSEFNNITIII